MRAKNMLFVLHHVDLSGYFLFVLQTPIVCSIYVLIAI
jgi:hypothetical protein